MSDDIPVIDLAAALATDAPDDLLATVRTAAETIGIIQVVNHGVPTEVIAGFDDGFRRVLDLPRAEKERLASPTGHPYRGWRQWPDDFGRLELERFSIAQYDDTEAARAAGLSAEHATLYEHANVWPPQEPGLRAATQRYHDAFVDVARRVLGLYARVLDVPAQAFPLGEDVYTTVVVNNYPKWPHEGASDEEKLLLLEHADSSVLTVLHQAGDYAGLQGQRPDGTWTPVPIRPDALQVFTGTLLTNWTEGRLRPGRHRVVAGGSVTRRSSAVFVHPSLDTVVAPLPEFADPDGSDFEPVSVWERASGNVEEYLRVFGRPEQLAAWRENRPYVAEVTA
ncbi:2-oxoglutarate and iron-dependent oxygenase domain-containing protein [Streptomyces sp. NPDC001811]